MHIGDKIIPWGRSAVVVLLVLAPACYGAGRLDDDDGSPRIDDDDSADDDDDNADDDDDLTGDDDDSTPIDSDEDGTPDEQDCAPEDPSVHPGASEICDGVDQDCDGVADDGVLSNFYVDSDGDGYGADGSLITGCDAPLDFIDVGGDCDDLDPGIHPGSNAQVDGVDSDCDGARDWLLTLYISVDDAFEYCIDDETNMLGDGNNWQTGYVFQQWLSSGQHVVGIQGWDLGYVITAAIAQIEISDGTVWISDASWKYDPTPADGSDRGGWCSPFFDDSLWSQANEIGPIGTSPWGNNPSVFPAGSAALWIWDVFPVDLNTQYLRKLIVLP